MQITQECGLYNQLSASAQIVVASGGTACGGALVGIFVSAASATPTITVYDDSGTGTTTKIVDTFTPAAGTYYKLPFKFSKGLYVAIGGTVSATVAYNPQSGGV